YGTLEGEAARLVASGANLDDLLKDGRATKRTYAEGEGRNRIDVTETLVLGEPYRVEVRFERYFDPIADVRDDEVAWIAYVHGKDGGFDVRDPADIRSILRAVRTESHQADKETGYRSYWLGGEDVIMHLELRGPGDWGEPGTHRCWLGLWIHATKGRTWHLCGEPRRGAFTAHPLLGEMETGKPQLFENQLLY
ncbi:MAG: hypothetical protein AAB215_01540, partial [Planctomycetota bacterium]